MSVEYYAKLERGTLAGVWAGVLDALARALQLDDAERVHLLRLAQEADGSNGSCRPRRPESGPSGRACNGHWTRSPPAPRSSGTTGWILGRQHLGRAMYADLLLDPTAKPNFARYTFLDNSARRFHPKWDWPPT